MCGCGCDLLAVMMQDGDPSGVGTRHDPEVVSNHAIDLEQPQCRRSDPTALSPRGGVLLRWFERLLVSRPRRSTT